MNGENGRPAADLGKLWDAWEQLTRELLRGERAAAHPYAVTRFEDCDGYVDDILTSVRQARISAERMRHNFPGFPPSPPVTREEL